MLTRETGRRLSLGAFVYQLYHRPFGAVRKSIAAGGPIAQWRTARGRAEMERAAHVLPVPAFTENGTHHQFHVLTGRKFWYQTAFCLWTFARHARRTLEPVIYDDGTLAPEHRAALTRLFPATRHVSPAEIAARLDAHLPADRFPFLRDRWKHYPNIRKLTDVHLGSTGWKFVLDSDLLFFRRPDFVLAWLDQPTVPLHAVDCETCYGYSRPLLDSLAGASLAEQVNVGLCGLDSGQLDWERIEHWCRTLIEREGTHYYLEQALVAMLVAGRRCSIAPEADYVTRPSAREAAACSAVMHHYVASSKQWYFRMNWRRALSFPA